MEHGDDYTPKAAPETATVSGITQRNLIVGRAHDPLEHEADTVADQMMRIPDPRPVLRGAPPVISRKCAAGEQLETKSDDTGAAVREAPPAVHEVVGSTGLPLDQRARRFFEPRFAADFSDVRVHGGDQAARSARAVGARAYAVGNHIVLGAPSLGLNNQAGLRLLAHELTHVMQQRGVEQPEHAVQVRRDADKLQTSDTAQVQGNGQAASAPTAPTVQKGGSINLKVQAPASVDGPTMGFVGVYKVMLFDAEMDFIANVNLNFPSGGDWEIGLVQNVEVVRSEVSYSSGGKVSIFIGLPLLDQNPDTNDIFLGDPEAIKNVSAGQTANVSFTRSDTPTTPPIMGLRTRCNNTISEHLESAVESTFFRIALVARQGTSVFQLAASEQYGYTWAFTVNANGIPDSPPQFQFSPNPPQLGLKVTSFTPVQTAPPGIMDFFAPAAVKAGAKYAQDCTKT